MYHRPSEIPPVNQPTATPYQPGAVPSVPPHQLDYQKSATAYSPFQPSLRGLESLMTVAGVRVQQQTELTEVLPSIDTPNKFAISALSFAGMQPIPGAPLLWAYETSNLSVRYYLAKDRPLKFFILASNQSGAPVLVMDRPFAILGKSVKVYDGSGHYVGRIRKKTSLLHAILSIQDADKKELALVKGPKSPGWRKLSIRLDGMKQGFIVRQLGAFTPHGVPDAYSFDLAFPPQANLQLRCLLLAAALFTDLLWFNK